MNFTINLTEIICALITVIAGIVTGFFIPWLKSKTSANTYSIIEFVCESAVYYAQQWFKTEEGEKKKEEAMKYAEAYLEQRGIKVDFNILSETIEAALKKIKSTNPNFKV